jgi:hypothetical protein
VAIDPVSWTTDNSDAVIVIEKMFLSDARFSSDRIYRYALSRAWDCSRPRIMFIGLNPSTSDELEDDPTIRRCLAYAGTWG